MHELALSRFGQRAARRRLHARPGLVLGAALMICGALTQACPARAGEGASAEKSATYILGPQDRVRLKVFEWRATRDELYAWTAMNDEFTIAADGTLSIPIIGEVQAAGLPLREVGLSIGVKLQQRMGMVEVPSAALEIVQYRPFYIDGQVDRPGEYPFRPGLTLAKAMAIAGGPPRIVDPALLRLEREAISARGDLALLRQEKELLSIRLARLLAEKDGQSRITVPKELADRSDAAAGLLIEREVSIFEARKKALSDQVEAVGDLKRFLRMQLEALTGQMATADAQVKLIDTEIKSSQQLADRGLVTQPRQLALGRAMAQMESEKLRINTDILRARETITRSDLVLLDQRSKRETDIVTELRDTQKLLDQVAPRIETTERLVLEAEISAPRALADRALAKRARPTYRITRQSGDRQLEFAADSTTILLPGDAVTVTAPTSDGFPTQASARVGVTPVPSID